MEISYFVGECFPGMKVINFHHFHHFHFLENVNDVENEEYDRKNNKIALQ